MFALATHVFAYDDEEEAEPDPFAETPVEEDVELGDADIPLDPLLVIPPVEKKPVIDPEEDLPAYEEDCEESTEDDYDSFDDKDE